MWEISSQIGNLAFALLGDFAFAVTLVALLLWAVWLAAWVRRGLKAREQRRWFADHRFGGGVRIRTGLFLISVISSVGANAPKVTLETDERATERRIQEGREGDLAPLNQAPARVVPDDEREREMRRLDEETDARTSAERE